jgi:trigger factor
MVQDSKIETLEKSAVKLTITVPSAEVSSAYEDLVRKYAKTAQIKGFRKGKVPRDILERKFGEAFRAETLQDLVEKGVQEAIEQVETKPLPYAAPSLVDEELDLDTASDLTFSVTYDVYPEFTVGEYRGLEITEAQVKIGKADEDRELEEMRQKNALVIDKEEGVVAAGDLVTVNFEEVDAEGTPVEGTRREDVSFTIGDGHNYYHLDSELIGFKVDEPQVVEKNYPEDFEHGELAGSTRRLQVTVTRVRVRDVPELDDEFAQDISEEFETLEDLRKDVKKRLEQTAESRIRARKIEQLLEQIATATPVEIPVSMVETELQQSWYNLAQQYRVTTEQLEQLLTMQGKTRDEIFDEWRPAAEERIKRSLIVQKMIEIEGIEVSEEDAEAEVRKDAEERSADPEQILEYYRNQGMLSYLQNEIAERRLFDAVLESAKIKKGEKIAYVDLIGENE